MVASVIFTPTGGSQTVLKAENGTVVIGESGSISGAAFYSGLPVPDASQATTGNVIINSNSNVSASTWKVGTSSETSVVTVEEGGSLTLDNSVTVSSNSKIVISAGGTLVLSGYATTTPGLIQFDEGGGGTIEIAAGTTPSIIGYITNIKENDTIILNGLSADGYTYVDGVYTLTNNGQPISGTSSFQLPAANQGTTFSVVTVNGKTYLTTLVVVCFLRGSMIRTPHGDVAVEDLSIGDEVSVYDWQANKEVNRKVVWVGNKKASVFPGLPDDKAGYPVRLLRDALGDGAPYKDLLITSEHCLFFEGKFVPVRMLVNGRSIFYDMKITSYEYFHIETEMHSVITANGVLTESYLDTGNRSSFRQSGSVVALPTDRKTWAENGSAPLDVSRSFVEPLFHMFSARAQSAKVENNARIFSLTEDAGLHLSTDTGAIIRKSREADGRVMFMIPADVKKVRLVSRTSRPSDSIGPFVDDRRNLGVLIGDIVLFEESRTDRITTHLMESTLEGWSEPEKGGMRWTMGNALLPLGNRSPNTIAILAIQIKAGGPYLVTEEQEHFLAQRA
ncbi:outer membrane protein [Gluconobacter thailandicus F149-1 = NBRC 100600]|uniref:Hint domain-containing protein n=1 Tax=Gluconobacter thailandicus TaxID=257438 RepID=UPI0002B9CF5D|nr:Hint domain-containing protein [Gluconobacter thailandicus]KXV54759.1 hypothetical protein AD946_01680 [Gluconobacter thailandicus]GAC89131.1 outer membrane protein [Gluconobacter thailandicus NBRC 3255]GAN92462.1 outer membrane protein [Gluconobacter thailandicus F149-1 = NBRC 100600]GBR61214.1 hypothetical protein AA100600_2577 [Gluconobacter thailandicus F149-1 = NBRC 100600]GEL87957.1 hypothetical protein GTH01_23150 [Gluconobacter thailandicus F149-1 = NBRC 100600]